MINLEDGEKQWIKLCKLHLIDKYPSKGSWVKTCKPLFEELYGWNPNIDIHSYRNILFNRLLGIYLKICHKDINSSIEYMCSELFYKSITNTSKIPIERGIHVLCSLIQNTAYLDNDMNPRFELDLPKIDIK